MTVRLIAHVLIQSGDDYLLLKRSEIKRGFSNVYPTYWDIPGGGVEKGELPRDGALRECFEEAGVRQIAVRSNFFTKIVNWIPLRILSLLA